VQTRNYYYQRSKYWQNNSIYIDNIYNKIALDVASMQFKHIKIGEDGMWNNCDSDLIHVLTVEPNSNDTPIYFWAKVIRLMLREGIVFIVPITHNGKLMSLEIADEVWKQSNGMYQVTIDNEIFNMHTRNLWILKNPKKNLTIQLNKITQLIDSNLNAIAEKLADQSAVTIKGFLKLPFVTMDTKSEARATKLLNQINEVASKGNIGYLDKDTEFQELRNEISTMQSSDLEFLKSQLYNAFGINEKLFTCDYSESQYRAYFNSILKIYQRVVSEEINRKHFTQTARTQGHRLKVLHDIISIASLKDFTEFASKGIFNALINADEAREVIGYAPYEGGDVYNSNLNAVPLGGDANENEDDDD
jgi:HK97 family phage portal protein